MWIIPFCSRLHLHPASKATWGSTKSLGLEIKSLQPSWPSVFPSVKWGQSYLSLLTGLFWEPNEIWERVFYKRESKLQIEVAIVSLTQGYTVKFFSLVPCVGSTVQCWNPGILLMPWPNSAFCPSLHSSCTGSYVAHHSQPRDHSKRSADPVWTYLPQFRKYFLKTHLVTKKLNWNHRILKMEELGHYG